MKFAGGEIGSCYDDHFSRETYARIRRRLRKRRHCAESRNDNGTDNGGGDAGNLIHRLDEALILRQGLRPFNRLELKEADWSAWNGSGTTDSL